jgi:hypothetical protein
METLSLKDAGVPSFFDRVKKLASAARPGLGGGGITKDFFDDILHGIPEYRERFSRDVMDLNGFVQHHQIPPVIALVLDQFPEVGGRGQHIAWLAEQALATAGMTVLNTDEYYRPLQWPFPLAGQQMGRSSERGGQRHLGADAGASRRAGYATPSFLGRLDRTGKPIGASLAGA